MDDIRNLTDNELEAIRIEVLTEKERRANLAAIPEQITALRGQYTAAGGNAADLDSKDESP